MAGNYLINTSNAISLTEATKFAAVDGKKPHPSTLWRWARVGVRGVRLRYARFGRRVVTSREAIEAFMQELAEADRRLDEATVRTSATVRQTPTHSRTDALAVAERELADAGI